MGIYDREYYRGEGSGPGWFGGVSPACKTIIAINAVVFLAERAFHIDPFFIRDWLAASFEGIFRQGRVWQLLTATFLHADLMHILGNMLFLWIVGREMEGLYGSRDFVAFYIASAVFSTLVWASSQAFADGLDEESDVGLRIVELQRGRADSGAGAVGRPGRLGGHLR